MHAVFYVPSVIAVPVLRPANASERAGHCIPGLQSHRNNIRNEVGVTLSLHGGFAGPGERLKTTEDALRAIARALRVQSGASPPQTDDNERPPTPLPDDFGTSSEDD